MARHFTRDQKLPEGAVRLLDDRFSLESITATLEAPGATIYVIGYDENGAIAGSGVVVVAGGPAWLRPVVWAENVDVVQAMDVAVALWKKWGE